MSFLKRGKKGKIGDGDFPTSPTASTTTPTSVPLLGTTSNSSVIFTDETMLPPQPHQSSSVPTTTDDDTVLQSGNARKITSTTSSTTATTYASLKSDGDTDGDDVPITPTPKKTKMSKSMTPGSGFVVSLAEELRLAQEQIAVEKAGKRKLFHSLVKVANELRKTKEEQQERQQTHFDRDTTERAKQWYDGGLWRAPQILPSVQQGHPSSLHHPKSSPPLGDNNDAGIHTSNVKTSLAPTPSRAGVREAISLSDLFFHLVIVTAFTRVGVAISNMGYVDVKSFLYFAIFWNIWSKEASYTSRFDTTDLSAQMENLVTCFAVLFGSLSVSADINSIDGTRIMIMASAVAILHCGLHIRVAISNYRGQTVSPAVLTTTSERTVVNPLTRTDTVFVPQSISFSACTAVARASTRRLGATASSRSRNSESAGPRAAFSKNFSDVAGTANSDRCSRQPSRVLSEAMFLLPFFAVSPKARPGTIANSGYIYRLSL